jgi:hypothetical protein
LREVAMDITFKDGEVIIPIPKAVLVLTRQ